MSFVANYSDAEFIRRQIGMVTEVLTTYGPVNRFWFDGTSSFQGNHTELWDQVYKTIRTVSPATMITAYRGDVCAAHDGQTLYTNSGPPPNTTDGSSCTMQQADGMGVYFHPTEEHGAAAAAAAAATAAAAAAAAVVAASGRASAAACAVRACESACSSASIRPR